MFSQWIEGIVQGAGMQSVPHTAVAGFGFRLQLPHVGSSEGARSSEPATRMEDLRGIPGSGLRSLGVCVRICTHMVL